MIRRRLQRLPLSEEALRTRRSLRWLGPLLRQPWLWQLSRRRVAAGAAIGVSFCFVFSVLRIALAAIAAVALRANLPMAAVSTLVSNPFAYVPIGVPVFAVVGGIVTWITVNVAWIALVAWRRRRRLEYRAAADTRT